MIAAPAPLPRIVTPRGKSLAWDEEDRLWLARAVEAEGEPRDLVAQVLVNRWAWLFDEVPGKYMKLRDLVRAYAQPVNPAWFPGGKLFEARVKTLEPLEQAQAQQQAKNRRDVHSTREQFSANTLTAVDQALRGPIVIPAGALHFAAPFVVRSDLPVLVPADSDRHNVIYGEASQRGARARYSITAAEAVATRSTSSTGGRVAAVVGILALGMGLGFGAARLK
jgi:hypothetical protein